ncbi:Bacterial Ig-like, group 1 domain protein, partial [mine drainage metagenome]
PAVAGAETVYVSVYGPSGFSSTGPGSVFNYAAGAAAAPCTLPTLGGGSQAQPSITSVGPSFGPTAGGNPVTIHGQNFTRLGVAQVVCTDQSCARQASVTVFMPPPVEFCAVGGTQCADATNVRLVDSSTIIADAPSGSGTVDVRVDGAGGFSPAGLSDEYSYSSTSPPGTPGLPATLTLMSGRPAILANGSDAAEVTASVYDAQGVPVPNVPVTFQSSLGSLSTGQSVQTDSYGEATINLTGTSLGQASVSATVYGATYQGQGLTGTIAVGLDPVPVVTGASPGTVSAGGGAVVDITGSGLTGATAVNFGTVPAASFQVLGDGEITAVAPPGSGGVAVSVENAAATSLPGSSAALSYTPVPIVTAVQPGGGRASGGGSVTITGLGFTGATAVDFGAGNPSPGFSVNPTGTAITATVPPGTGMV